MFNELDATHLILLAFIIFQFITSWVNTALAARERSAMIKKLMARSLTEYNDQQIRVDREKNGEISPEDALAIVKRDQKGMNLSVS